MASLGRSPGAAPLTSADIPDNSITTAKIVDDNVTAAKIPAGAVSSDVVYLENNTSTQDLSGTYSTERLYFNDSYQLTGDVTVTGHLALGTIADEDVVITQDSTERTITGSGTLEAGNVLQDTHRTSLTDMTGVLEDAVTGSPNLNLGNATFPAGHIINVETAQQPSGTLVLNSGTELYSSTVLTISVTAGNKLIVNAIGGTMGNENGTSTFGGCALNAYYSSTDHKLAQLNCWYPSSTGGAAASACGIWIIAGSGSISVEIRLGLDRGNTTHYQSWWIDDGADYGKCFVTAMEVQT
jgi:hypothetical protein